MTLEDTQKKETVKKIVGLLTGLDYITALTILDEVSECILKKSVIVPDEDVQDAQFNNFIARLQGLLANSKEV